MWKSARAGWQVPRVLGATGSPNWGTHGSPGLCSRSAALLLRGPQGSAVTPPHPPPSVEKEHLHPFPNKRPRTQEAATFPRPQLVTGTGRTQPRTSGPGPPAPPAPGPRDALGVWGPGGPRRCRRAPPSPRTPAQGTGAHSSGVGRATRRECSVRTEAGCGGPAGLLGGLRPQLEAGRRGQQRPQRTGAGHQHLSGVSAQGP